MFKIFNIISNLFKNKHMRNAWGLKTCFQKQKLFNLSENKYMMVLMVWKQQDMMQ